MASRMSKKEWKLLSIVAVLTDLLQLVLDIFTIGAVVNRIIDVVFGFSLAFYFQIRGVSMFNPKRAAAFMATIVGEMIPVVDALPLWTLDVYVTYLTTKGEETLMERAPKIIGYIQENRRIVQQYQPKNQGGVRMPNSRQNQNRNRNKPISTAPSSIPIQPINPDSEIKTSIPAKSSSPTPISNTPTTPSSGQAPAASSTSNSGK